MPYCRLPNIFDYRTIVESCMFRKSAAWISELFRFSYFLTAELSIAEPFRLKNFRKSAASISEHSRFPSSSTTVLLIAYFIDWWKFSRTVLSISVLSITGLSKAGRIDIRTFSIYALFDYRIVECRTCFSISVLSLSVLRRFLALFDYSQGWWEEF